MTLEEVGARIGKIRKLRKMTYEELADAVGVSASHISRLQSGTQGLRADVLLRLGLALNVHPCYFFMNDKEWKIFEQIDKENHNSK